MRVRVKTNWLHAVSLLSMAYQHIVSATGGQHWFTSTGLVEDPEYPLPGTPIHSSGGNSLVGVNVNTRRFDLIVSLHSSPQGDNDGNTQDADARSVDQDKIEKIIQFMADAIYEASEGAHKLGQVRIFRDKLKHDVADIRWDALGHPSSHLNGIGDMGLHIFMYDVFQGGQGNGIDYDLLSDLIGSGYTLAHEFGHYAYGLKDEYPLRVGDIAVEPSIMNSQWRARDAVTQSLVNAQWLQFSIKHQGYPLGPYQNTLMTAQHRQYGESCWETLSRNNSLTEELRAFQTGQAVRIFYPELADVSPTRNNTPSVPDLPGTARSDLDIIWMSNLTIFEIVIDSSGSMASDNKMSNAKTAAKLLIDLTKVGSYVGVMKFTSSPTQVFPITQIINQDSKETIKAAIDTLYASDGTSIGAAAQAALNGLTAAGVPDGNKVVYLLSDGQSGDNSLAPIPGYQAAKIPIFTFSYGADADTVTLGTMASMTKGELYISPVGLAAITQAFQDANAAASGASSVASGSSTASLGTIQTVPVSVDSTLHTISLTVTYQGHSSDLSFVFIDPGNVSNRLSPNSITESGGETLVLFSVVGPTPGEWLIEATSRIGNDVPFDFQLTGTQEGSGYTLTGGTYNKLREIQYPEPFILRSSLVKDLPIVNAVVEALITFPNGSMISIPMTDDGTPPDNIAGDGDYTAAVNYDQSGVYEVLIRARGQGGVAMQDAQTLEPAPGPNGDFVTFGSPFPLTEDFERFARFQIETMGVVTDDHGNKHESATDLSAKNDISLPGKIEIGGDVDVFKIVSIPNGLTQLVIRVSNLAFGMIPALKIRNELMVDLANGTLDSSQSQAGLLSLAIPVSGNETYFAEVSHQDINGTGYYQISAGSILAKFDLPSEPTKTSKSAKKSKTEKTVEAKSEKKMSAKTF